MSYKKDIVKNFIYIISIIIAYNFIHKIFSYWFPNKKIVSLLTCAALVLITSIIQYVICICIPKYFFNKKIAAIKVLISSNKDSNKKGICISRSNLKDSDVFELKANVQIKVFRTFLFNLMKRLGATLFIYAGPPDTVNFTRAAGKEYRRCRIIPGGVYIDCFFISRNGERDEYSWNIDFGTKIFDDSCSKINFFLGLYLGTKNHKIKLIQFITNNIFHINMNKEHFYFKLK